MKSGRMPGKGGRAFLLSERRDVRVTEGQGGPIDVLTHRMISRGESSAINSAADRRCLSSGVLPVGFDASFLLSVSGSSHPEDGSCRC